MSSIIKRIDDMVWYITDPNMDGFTQWGRKQQLYEILWKTQWALQRCQTFHGEREWVEKNKPSL